MQSQEAQEAADIPMPNPTYVSNCWHCFNLITDLICENGGLDPVSGEPNGYVCNGCGKHLGDWRRRFVEIKQ